MAFINYVDKDIAIGYSADFNFDQNPVELIVTKEMIYLGIDMCLGHMLSIPNDALNHLATVLEYMIKNNKKKFDKHNYNNMNEIELVNDSKNIHTLLTIVYDASSGFVISYSKTINNDREPTVNFEYTMNSELFIDKYNMFLAICSRHDNKNGRNTEYMRNIDKMLFDIKFKEVPLED
jgi:hypothetical protein